MIMILPEGSERTFLRGSVKTYCLAPAVPYDITSTYTSGSFDTLSRNGYIRDNRKDPEQINIGLAVTETESFPIMHQVLEKILAVVVDRHIIDSNYQVFYEEIF